MFENALKTRLQGSSTRGVWEDKREGRIREALDWGSGSADEPQKHLVTILANGIEAYFLKPGKEAFNQKRPNPNDMLPVVGSPEIKLRFDDIWTYLSKISVINFEDFKTALVLIYRNAYFLDHVKKDNKIRYEPNYEITKCIEQIENETGEGSPFGLMGFLNFLDLLGWNEDMKYHVENNQPTFSGKYGFRVGRINTLLTCIRVPYQASAFVTHCIDKSSDKRNIDFSRLYTIMQQFAKSRGTCTPTQQQLKEWLSPYIADDKYLTS